MGEHKYAELVLRLREEILSGKYVSGQKLPSENQLSEETGYSRQTVRRAMSILESEGLTNRVQGSGTYVRSALPKREATRNIAVVTSYIGEYIFPAILQGIDHVLAGNGYTTLLMATRNRVDNERRILQDLLHKPIDGLIVEGTKTALPNPNIDMYDRFNELNIPVVFFNGYYSNLKRPIYVVADDRAGGQMACQALLDKGHTRIAGIFKSDDIQGHRRYAGYAEALRLAGLTVADDHVVWYTTESREGILGSGIPQAVGGCTAVVCYNDEIAMQVLHRMGISAPGQLDIASFDYSTFAQFSPVPFLSLSSPKEDLGRMAAEKMLHILQGQMEKPLILPWSTGREEVSASRESGD
ncbi:MAG: substrate-binding domain-containing protein [Oscillospiraceae bacterium]|jgi:GntR family transcriptional regulator of arabinose operon|nr:substrate-binding domain-containing protein [Oscillospiraceae bacterium]